MNDVAIRSEGLGRRFGKHWAVRDMNLVVPQGAVLGLLGPNGAGKSTTIRMLMGLLPPSQGRLQVLGIDPVKDDVAVRRRVGYVAEVHGFYEWMKVGALIRLVAAYHRDWNPERCATLQASFGLASDAAIKTLSKGARAKLALLLALSFEPELLVLDEPTGGLDPAARRSFIESILGDFQAEGRTILVASHLLNEFAGLLDHVVFMKQGALHLATPMDELYARNKRVRLIFPDGVPPNFVAPEALRTRINGREAVLTMGDFHPERTPALLQGLGASDIRVEEMTLEDIFVDRVGS